MLARIGQLVFYWRRLQNRLINRYLQRHFERRMKHVGKGVYFNGISRITGLDQIEIEDNVHLGDNAFIRAEGGLFIGANTHFSRNLVLYTHNHDYQGEVLPYDNSFRYRKVTIGRNVWVGMNVVILPGATIGDGAIIGAGAVVSGTVAALAIVGAPPASVIKERDAEHYQRLENEGRYGGPNGVPLPPSPPTGKR